MDKQELYTRRQALIEDGNIVIDLPGCWLILRRPGTESKIKYSISQDSINVYMESEIYTGGDPFQNR